MQGKIKIISETFPEHDIVSGEPALNETVPTQNDNETVCSKDYSEFVDITKTAKLQRALKWAGLKPVSNEKTLFNQSTDYHFKKNYSLAFHYYFWLSFVLLITLTLR